MLAVHTMFATLSPGAVMTFVGATIDGLPREPIAVGSDLYVEYACGDRVGGRVISSEDGKVAIQLKDGTTYFLRPHGPGDRPHHYTNSGGLDVSHWVIERKAE